jgi:preprotein translocase subunit SecD
MGLVLILFIFSTVSHQQYPNLSAKEFTFVDTVSPSKRTYQSGFYLLTADTTGSHGIKVVNKDEYYFADSMPIIPIIYIDSTYKQFDKYNSRFELVFIFNRTGTRIWSEFTWKNTNRTVGLIIKNQLLNAARIQGQIPTGVTSLTGLYSENEADELVSTIDEEINRVREEAKKSYR